MKLSDAIKRLSDASVDSPRENARTLFSHFDGVPAYRLISADPETNNPLLIEAIERRAGRVPLQYIIGEVDFFRERYAVSEGCLIPRADTEILVEYAVKRLKPHSKILDVCCGSGCIAISTVKNTEGTTALALDISAEALKIAETNAKLNKVEGRVEFLQLDVLHGELPKVGKFHCILSNPPYVKDGVYDTLEEEIFHEPKIAFVGGEDGGDFYRKITARYKSLLCDGGFIAYEIGYDQSELISDVARANGMTLEIINDLSGNPRVAILER